MTRPRRYRVGGTIAAAVGAACLSVLWYRSIEVGTIYTVVLSLPTSVMSASAVWSLSRGRKAPAAAVITVTVILASTLVTGGVFVLLLVFTHTGH